MTTTIDYSIAAAGLDILIEEIKKNVVPPGADAATRQRLLDDAKRRARERVVALELTAKKQAWQTFDGANAARLGTFERLHDAALQFGAAYVAAVAATATATAAFPADAARLPAGYAEIIEPTLSALAGAWPQLPMKPKACATLPAIARGQTELLHKVRAAEGCE